MTRVSAEAIRARFHIAPTEFSSERELWYQICYTTRCMVDAADEENGASLCRLMVRLRELIEEAEGKPFDHADFWSCHPCSECSDTRSGHHFGDMYLDAEEIAEDGPDVGCKHCGAFANYCGECDGGVVLLDGGRATCDQCHGSGVQDIRLPPAASRGAIDPRRQATWTTMLPAMAVPLQLAPQDGERLAAADANRLFGHLYRIVLNIESLGDVDEKSRESRGALVQEGFALIEHFAAQRAGRAPLAREQHALEQLFERETAGLGLRCQLERQVFTQFARWRMRVFREDDFLFEVCGSYEELGQRLPEWLDRTGARHP